jgi:hypothetical protein
MTHDLVEKFLEPRFRIPRLEQQPALGIDQPETTTDPKTTTIDSSLTPSGTSPGHQIRGWSSTPPEARCGLSNTEDWNINPSERSPSLNTNGGWRLTSNLTITRNMRLSAPGDISDLPMTDQQSTGNLEASSYPSMVQQESATTLDLTISEGKDSQILAKKPNTEYCFLGLNTGRAENTFSDTGARGPVNESANPDQPTESQDWSNGSSPAAPVSPVVSDTTSKPRVRPVMPEQKKSLAEQCFQDCDSE